MSWLPPNESAVPGIIRNYIFSYRILNESSSGITSLTLKASTLKYVIDGLFALSWVQINISAFTVSSGPEQTIMALTDEGGKTPLVYLVFDTSLYPCICNDIKSISALFSTVNSS